MPDFITLSCPSCGAKLEITQDINRFACSHCGQEHLVKRSGGIVSLSPVVDAINQVKFGVDKTAAELALERISKEIAILVAERNNIFAAHPYPKDHSVAKLVSMIVIGVVLILLAVGLFSTQDVETCGTYLLLPGIVLVVVGMVPILSRSVKRPKEKELWQANFGVRVRAIDEQIATKQREMERNRELVSQ